MQAIEEWTIHVETLGEPFGIDEGGAAGVLDGEYAANDRQAQHHGHHQFDQREAPVSPGRPAVLGSRHHHGEAALHRMRTL